jgi:hypothetical protein
LRELLRDRDGFKYVIRQVGKIWYLIDLEECKGYEWVEGTFSLKTIFDQMKDTLYLYEPGEEKAQSPMALNELPSLATLSPFAIRIAESRLTERALEYTSVYVESKVEQILDAIPLKEKAQTVLKRLNNEAVDLSGKSLEAVGTQFLSRGSNGTKYKWESKRVGTPGAWSDFITTKRKVVRLWDITELLSREGQILVSTSTNFPLGDIVFSRNNATDPIDVIQFTWQLKHPFTIRALYDLRVKRLEASHEFSVRGYMISPLIEDTYASMIEIDFLKGSLVKPFEYSKTRGVTPPADLENMWNNTEVHVIRPKTAWRTLLVDFINSGS